MKKVSVTLLLFLLSAAVFASVPTFPHAEKKYMTPEELRGMLERGEDVLVLDLRKAEDYENGHIPGAVNAVLSDAVENNDYVSSLRILTSVLERETGKGNGRGTDIVLACYTGNRYAQAASDILSWCGNNLERVWTLQGGNSAWFGEDREVKEAPAAGSGEYSHLFDFSRDMGGSDLPVYRVLDLIGIATPCTFTTLSEEAGYVPSDLFERTLGVGDDMAVLNDDKTVTINYANGVTATGYTKWPSAKGALASLLPDMVAGMELCCAVWTEDVLVVSFFTLSPDGYTGYRALLSSVFPLAEIDIPGFYMGRNNRGERILFSLEDKALRIDRL